MQRAFLRLLSILIVLLAGCDNSTSPEKNSPPPPPQPIGISWQWINPTPQGNHLTCVTVAPGGHAFAGGYGGTIMEWNGSTWARLETVTGWDIWGIWAESDTRVIVTAAAGEILTWENGKWYRSFDADNCQMNGVHGNGTRTVAVGTEGEFVSREAGSWVKQNIGVGGNFEDVWVSPSGTAFVTMDDGRVGVWSGGAMQDVRNVSAGYLGPIWGNSDTDVYAGGGTTLKHFNGVAWSDVTLPAIDGVTALWTPATGEVFVTTYHGDIGHLTNGTWDLEKSDKGLRGLGGRGKTLFAVGNDGRILERDNGSWNQHDHGPTRPINGLYALSSNEVLACGGGGLVLRVTPDGVIDSTKVDTAALAAIDGDGPNNIYTVGEFYPGGRRVGAIYHYDGVGWTRVHTSFSHYRDVCVIAPDSVVVMGDDGEVTTFNGQSWNTLFAAGIDYQHDMWCAPDSSVFIVGERIDILNNNHRTGFVRVHKKGDPWMSATISGSQRFVAVWGHSSSELWASTDHGAFWKFNGYTWTNTTSMEGSPWVYELGGNAAGDVLVGTGFGVVRAGTDFVADTPGLSRTIAAFALLPDGSVWAAGEAGTIVRLGD
jgi:hypothetical protein